MKKLIALAVVIYVAQHAAPVYQTVANVFSLKAIVSAHVNALNQ